MGMMCSVCGVGVDSSGVVWHQYGCNAVERELPLVASSPDPRDAEIARLKAEVSEARRHAVGVMAAGFNRALDEAGAPPAESPGLRVYAMRDEIARLKDRAEKAAAARDLLLDCNEAMREPMAALRAAVGMPAEGEGAVVAKVLSERTEALAANAELRAALERLHTLAVRCLGHSERVDQLLGPTLSDLAALLSRPDLGAGMVLVGREVLERVMAAMDQWLWLTGGGRPRGYREMVADLDALLKKGGG